MASDTNATLITLKLEALYSIIANMPIRYTEVKNKISLLTDSSIGFESILNIFNPSFTKLSSVEVNGSTLLAYLDFYSLYVILYANINPIKNLQSISENKLAYLLSICKDVSSIFKEKELQKVNRYVIHTDFLNPKGIDLSISKGYLQRDRLSNALATNGALTLPISFTKDIKPVSFLFSDTDKALNIIENRSSGDSVDYSINRKGFNKVGVVQLVKPMKKDNRYNENPKITGSIYGYFSQDISIVVREILESGIVISASSDNLKWSDSVTVPFDTPTSILVDDDNYDIGLSIEFSSLVPAAVNDAWKVEFDYIVIDNPELTCTAKFSTLENISFIKWDDVAKNSCEIIEHKVRLRKNEDLTSLPVAPVTNGINIVAPVFDKVDEYQIKVKQNSYYVDSVAGDLVHRYDFMMSDITGVYNEYKSYGITSFAGFDVLAEKPILSLGLDSNEMFTGDKQFIEHTLMITLPRTVVYIPVLNKADTEITEYIVPTIDIYGTGTHITRFPVRDGERMILKNVVTGEEEELDQQNLSFVNITSGGTNSNKRYKIEIQNYDLSSVYTITYTPRIHSYQHATNYIKANGQWMCNSYLQESDVYWMYYKDVNGNNRLAISCGLDELIDVGDEQLGTKMIPFYGKVSSIIEMRSLDKGDKTPVIFNYKLTGN